MATVHFGRLLGTGGFTRTVAIKRLHGEYLDNPEFLSTLLDEARLASRIRHPNVVATLDMVTAEDEIFLVMEYVAGETLAHLLQAAEERGAEVDPRIAAGILCGVLYGLQAAHDATDEQGGPLGIVHRDVSPQNVLVGTDGLARLLDFGIAKGKGRLQTTRAGQLKGKVSYMAPEQILGEEPDRRSDVYAAAVVLWEVLAGKRLFPSGDTAGSNVGLIPKILEADIAPPSSWRSGLQSELDAITMRGLNRDPDARYATAHAFAVALEEIVGVATHRQIGEWVGELAAATLGEREAQLKALEAASFSADRPSAALIDGTVKARQRKRLASRSGEGRAQASGHEVEDEATAVETGPATMRDGVGSEVSSVDASGVNAPLDGAGYDVDVQHGSGELSTTLASSYQSDGLEPRRRSKFERPIVVSVPASVELPMVSRRWVYVAIIAAVLVVTAAIAVLVS